MDKKAFLKLCVDIGILDPENVYTKINANQKIFLAGAQKQWPVTYAEAFETGMKGESQVKGKSA